MLRKLLFPHSTPFRKAKALYACKAEHDSELSFTAGTVFDNGESPSLAKVPRTEKKILTFSRFAYGETSTEWRGREREREGEREKMNECESFPRIRE
jgi:hypothetical protein